MVEAVSSHFSKKSAELTSRTNLQANLQLLPSSSQVGPSTALRLFAVRGVTVVLDSDLAALYGVTTGNFNKAVTRNLDRFPPDFTFVLDRGEFRGLIFQIGTSKSRGGRRKLPRMFTEHGAIMAATILNSSRAAAMSVYVVRAFVRMREELLGRAHLETRLAEIERALVGHDVALRELYRRIKPLLLPPRRKRRREIGFHVKV
jgi:hypothetical protein